MLFPIQPRIYRILNRGESNFSLELKFGWFGWPVMTRLFLDRGLGFGKSHIEELPRMALYSHWPGVSHGCDLILLRLSCLADYFLRVAWAHSGKVVAGYVSLV